MLTTLLTVCAPPSLLLLLLLMVAEAEAAPPPSKLSVLAGNTLSKNMPSGRSFSFCSTVSPLTTKLGLGRNRGATGGTSRSFTQSSSAMPSGASAVFSVCIASLRLRADDGRARAEDGRGRAEEGREVEAAG